ncbi:MAG: 3-hydroxy-3-methylglutaryl-CoA reductase [Deltaproteobacteria bacterium]|nr:3-hydroxy-3-methylglutaryl-CoA reductase [Deltaproteobacteria bacterium]
MPHWPRANRPEAIRHRQESLKTLPHWDATHHHVLTWPVSVESLADFQECLSGHVVLPVGVVGPLPVSLGHYILDAAGAVREETRADDQVFVPLAHTEGGLSASVQRGISAVTLAGGVRTHILADRMTRDSCFVFHSATEALTLARWVMDQESAMTAWLGAAAQRPCRPTTDSGDRTDKNLVSTHAVLRAVDTHVVGPMCHLLYRFTTGDACGPNMITRNSYALNQEFVLARFPHDTGVTPLHVFLETNMGGDKKPSYAFFQFPGHGKVVLAEATLPGDVLRRVLRVRPEEVLTLEHTGLHGAHASGMQSFAFTPASAIAAIFAATGQDLGMVGTSSMAQVTVTRAGDGLHLAIRFSGLEVGTVGGGTSLPHARSYLQLMDCLGPGKVYRFAQIIAATALCLELSAAASMAAAGSQNFLQAHLERGGIR